MRVFLIGFMGSGKTYWGQRLSTLLKIPFFDLDTVIVEKENKTIPQLFAERGEESFRMTEKETLEALIEENPSMVLSCGGGTPCFFNNIDRMKKYGVVVWLNTPVDVILERLMKEKEGRPLVRDIAENDLRAYIVRKLNERRIYYEQANVVLDNENAITAPEFIQTILHA